MGKRTSLSVSCFHFICVNVVRLCWYSGGSLEDDFGVHLVAGGTVVVLSVCVLDVVANLAVNCLELRVTVVVVKELKEDVTSVDDGKVFPVSVDVGKPTFFERHCMRKV